MTAAIDLLMPGAELIEEQTRGPGLLGTDNGTGTCVVAFDTEEHARAAVGPLMPAAGPPVITSGVYEVEIEA